MNDPNPQFYPAALLDEHRRHRALMNLELARNNVLRLASEVAKEIRTDETTLNPPAMGKLRSAVDDLLKAEDGK